MLFLAALGGAANASKIIGAPYGTRTRVTAVKGLSGRLSMFIDVHRRFK
jgi:hypothetical protein